MQATVIGLLPSLMPFPVTVFIQNIRASNDCPSTLPSAASATDSAAPHRRRLLAVGAEMLVVMRNSSDELVSASLIEQRVNTSVLSRDLRAAQQRQQQSSTDDGSSSSSSSGSGIIVYAAAGTGALVLALVVVIVVLVIRKRKQERRQQSRYRTQEHDPTNQNNRTLLASSINPLFQEAEALQCMTTAITKGKHSDANTPAAVSYEMPDSLTMNYDNMKGTSMMYEPMEPDYGELQPVSSSSKTPSKTAATTAPAHEYDELEFGKKVQLKTSSTAELSGQCGSSYSQLDVNHRMYLPGLVGGDDEGASTDPINGYDSVDRSDSQNRASRGRMGQYDDVVGGEDVDENGNANVVYDIASSESSGRKAQNGLYGEVGTARRATMRITDGVHESDDSVNVVYDLASKRSNQDALYDYMESAREATVRVPPQRSHHQQQQQQHLSLAVTDDVES